MSHADDGPLPGGRPTTPGSRRSRFPRTETDRRLRKEAGVVGAQFGDGSGRRVSLSFPQIDTAIAGSGELPSGRRHRERFEGGRLTPEVRFFLRSVKAPAVNGSVAGSTEQVLAVRRETDSPHFLGQPFGNPLRAVRRYVPKADGLIRAGGSQSSAIGRELESGDPLLVPGESAQRSERREIPESDAGVRKASARRHDLAVRTGGDGRDRLAVPRKISRLARGTEVTQTDATVRFVLGEDDALVVRTKRPRKSVIRIRESRAASDFADVRLLEEISDQDLPLEIQTADPGAEPPAVPREGHWTDEPRVGDRGHPFSLFDIPEDD